MLESTGKRGKIYYFNEKKNVLGAERLIASKISMVNQRKKGN